MNQKNTNSYLQKNPKRDLSFWDHHEEKKSYRLQLQAASDGVLSGTQTFSEKLKLTEQNLEFKWHLSEGQIFFKDQKILTLVGPISSQQLSLASHYLMHLTSVSTHTHSFVNKYKDNNAIWLPSLMSTPSLEKLELESFAIGGGTIENHSQPLIRLNVVEYFALGGASQIQNSNPDLNPIIHVVISDLEELKDMRTEKIQGICLKKFNKENFPKLKNIIKDWNISIEIMDIKDLREPEFWLENGIQRFRLFRPFFEWVNFDFCLPSPINDSNIKPGENF